MLPPQKYLTAKDTADYCKNQQKSVYMSNVFYMWIKARRGKSYELHHRRVVVIIFLLCFLIC